MPQPLSGPGIGLQVPQLLYPSNLTNGEITTPTNTFALAPGQAVPIPAGRWELDLGNYGVLEYLDPVTGVWTLTRGNDNNGGTAFIWSDGFNVRVANRLSCPVGAVVTNGGNGSYAQTNTTVTPSAGNSTWQAVIGGAISTTVSITSGGSGYGIAPLVFFSAPGNPGVQATGIATISTGTVSSITVIDQGAGYTVAPSITILPNPADPNITSSITNATAVATLTGTGSVTAVLCTNPGAPVALNTTLTIAGSGASATATPLFLQTVTGLSVTSGGNGYGTAAKLTTTGGYNNTASPAFANPIIQQYNFVPRPADIPLTLAAGVITSATSIVDGGLFITTPAALAIGSGIVSTAATLALTMGSANTAVRLQQVS